MASLRFDNRYFQLTRSFAVKNFEDALIELLTNCVDAYTRLGDTASVKPVHVKLSNDRKTISILDNGVGMFPADAEYNLLNVGKSNTDSSKTRGVFNRGARDCTSIGTIRFYCLRENQWCRVVIRPNLTAEIIPQPEIPKSEIDAIFSF